MNAARIFPRQKALLEALLFYRANKEKLNHWFVVVASVDNITILADEDELVSLAARFCERTSLCQPFLGRCFSCVLQAAMMPFVEGSPTNGNRKRLPIEFEIYEMPKNPEVSPMRTRLFFNPPKSRIVFAKILDTRRRDLGRKRSSSGGTCYSFHGGSRSAGRDL